MAYENDLIYEDDYFKYDLENMCKKWGIRGHSSDWAIDRERDIWVRLYRTNIDRDEGGAEMSKIWEFYWKGSAILIETKTMKTILYTENNGVAYIYAKILNIVTTAGRWRAHKIIDKEQNKIMIDFPQELLPHKDEILKDLKEALEAYFFGAGIRKKKEIKSYKVDLEYEGELI
jgi:hypothetical protein